LDKVLIIEDEKGLQITLEDRLNAEGYEVTIRGDGNSGEEEALKNKNDIILLDIMLPGKDGYAVCENIRKAGLTTPVLMLTARNTNLDTVLGLRFGADDYLAKPFDMYVLLARIEALLRRSTLNSTASKDNKKKLPFGEFLLDRDKGELLKNGNVISLYGQEYRLLEYLVNNKDMVISRNTLLDKVWGYDTETSSRTVDVHIAKIRQKLGESEIPCHILTIRGRGYKFTEI
jgi:two-component system, OmpR family, alkaline phosphatase synthesis response regulator PhoP